MYKTIKVSQLGKHKKEYEFTIKNDGATRFHILIPGSGGGPDGPTDPDYPEQEQWMRDNSGLKEVWFLMWSCPDKKTLQKFLDKMEAFLIP